MMRGWYSSGLIESRRQLSFPQAASAHYSHEPRFSIDVKDTDKDVRNRHCGGH